MTTRGREVRERQRLLALLGGCCAHCLGTERLEFDHIDPTTKVANISLAIREHWDWETMRTELSKCQILCRACHIEKTKTDGTVGKIVAKITHKHRPHGTLVRCVMDGCRCSECRAWRASYRKGLVDAQGCLTGRVAPAPKPRYRPPAVDPVQLVCPVCGSKFERTPAQYRKSVKGSKVGVASCSRSCGNVLANRNR